uniref:Ycf36 n=1 Tax=Compsopogon caeruleus TaxID=31354 RepID=A0A1Z1XB01_9RHOD|nr:hypothetical protein [Compsopogon caeruleus]ARX96034.1 hypothetical protein [Compsopogon caeruleus]
MSKYSKLCPVPIEQQPLEEYKSLINSIFFKLPTYSYTYFFQFLLLISIFMIFLFILIICYNVLVLVHPLSLMSLILILLDSIIIFTLLFLYSAWSYITQRLLNSVVYYEESGWYDGEIWVKTPEVLLKDRLVANNTSIPLLNKIRNTFISISFKLLLEIYIYFSLSFFNYVL